MFIKILTPNHNGMIELTVKDLEALIQEAVDKATREKCAGCSRSYSYLNSVPAINLKDSGIGDNWDPYKVTCDTASLSTHATGASSNITGSVNTIGTTIGLNKNVLD